MNASLEPHSGLRQFVSTTCWAASSDELAGASFSERPLLAAPVSLHRLSAGGVFSQRTTRGAPTAPNELASLHRLSAGGVFSQRTTPEALTESALDRDLFIGRAGPALPSGST